jgi:hypothetical protein
MEKPVDRIRGILNLESEGWSGDAAALPGFFLCGFDWFRIDHFAIASHGFVDQFTKNSGTWLPVSTLRLKPDECFWADVNDYSWHGCAKIGFNNIQ